MGDIEPLDDMDKNQFVKYIGDYRFLSMGKARSHFRNQLEDDSIRWCPVGAAAIGHLFALNFAGGHRVNTSGSSQARLARLCLPRRHVQTVVEASNGGELGLLR